MADDIERLRIRVEIDSSGVREGRRNISRELEALQDRNINVNVNSNEFNSNIRNMTNSLSSFERASVTAFGFNQILQFTKAVKNAAEELYNMCSELTEAASALTEVQNVVDVTYGTMASDVQEYADTAMESFGLSELSAKQYVGTLGAILKSAGFATNDALSMSKTLTSLSADLASFYNKSVEEVYTKIRSGVISGETEAIKDLGINMNVAALNAYAMANGITTAYADMSSAEQTLLRFNYVLQNTAIQQGDFARTSDSWANSTKMLGQQFDELKAKIGNGLIQVFTPALQVIGKVLAGLNSIIDKVYKFLGLSTKVESTYDNISTNGMQKNDDGTIDISKPRTQIEESSSPTFTVPSANTALSDTNKELEKAAKNANKTAKGLKDANDNAKKLKNNTLGFDEANILSDNSGSGSLSDQVGKIKDANNALDGSTAALSNMAKALTDTYDSVNGVVDQVSEDASSLKDMFGNVHLNMDQVKEVAKQIVGEGDLKEIGRLTREIDKLDKIHENLNSIKTDLNAYDWMINMGIQLTPDEYKDYKKKVWEYAEEVQNFIKQQGVVVKISADILFGEGSQEGKEAEQFYAEMQKKAKSISDKMKAAFSKAFDENGRLINIDSYKEFEHYQKQLSDLENKISNYEVNVELNKLNFKASGADLDEESFDALMKQMRETVQKKIDGYQTAAAEYKAYLQTKLEMKEISKSEYDKEIAKVTKSLNDKITAANETVINFAVETMISFTAKDDQIKQTFKKFTDDLSEKMEGFANAADTGNWAEALFQMDDIVKSLDKEIDNYSPELRKCAKKVLSEIGVDSSELEKQISEYQKAGKKIPETLQNQLTNVKMLEALAGDSSALLWVVGNQLKGTDYEKVIQSAKKAGVDIPDELINSLNSKKVDLNNGVAGLLSGVSTKFKTDTTASDAAKKSGTKVNESYNSGVLSKPATFSEFFFGAKGAFDKDKSVSSAANAKGKTVGNSFIGAINGVATGLGKLFSNTTKTVNNDKSVKKTMSSKGSYDAGSYIGSINGSNANLGTFFTKVKNNAKSNNTARSGFTSLASRCASSYNHQLNKCSTWGVKDFSVHAVNSAYAGAALAISGGKSYKFSKIATYCANGYADLSNNKNKNTTKKSVLAWCGVILSTVTGALGIHSPSTKFKGFAGFSVDGYTNEIDNSYGKTERTMKNWGNYISECGQRYIANDFSGLTTSLTGNVTENFNASVTGSLQNAVNSVMNNMKFYANVKVGDQIKTVEFVNDYNRMLTMNPNFGFNV